MNNHCCSDMENSLTLNCDQHTDEYSCPDVLINYSDKFDEYGLIIHDGGSSSLLIQYCPFCGTKMPESKRDLWFDTLESMGFDDPAEQEIPEQFNSRDWYEST
jgi:hypothetical protein